MAMLIHFHNKRIPVYFKGGKSSKKAITLLVETLEQKIKTGKAAVKKCLDSLISIEIDGCEAILHAIRESDSLALSLY